MMYVIYIKDHIYHLMIESEMSIFACNSDQKVYLTIRGWRL